MAPRRGGGGSSGGGGGGVAGLKSPWGDPFQYRGSKFSDPIARGTIIVLGICAFALLVIAIAAGSLKKTTAANRSIFTWFGYGFSISMAIIAIGSDLASSIIRDSDFVVQRIYILIEMILHNFYYLAEISLLATVYCVLTVCFLHSHSLQGEKAPSKWIKALGWIHFIFLAILYGLWVGIMYTSLKYRIDVVTYNYPFTTADPWLKLNLAYTVLYLCATVEVVAWAIISFLKSRKQKNEIRNILLFLSFVAIPLLIRSFFITGVAARRLKHKIPDLTRFITLLFIQIFTVLAYSGVFLIARQLEKSQTPQPDHPHPNGFIPPPNGYAPYAPYAPNASYPPPWQGHGGGQAPPMHQSMVNPYQYPNQPTPGHPGFQNSGVQAPFLPPHSTSPSPPPPPQMTQGSSAYAANVVANSPDAPWASQGYHANGYAPVPQHNGGGGIGMSGAIRSEESSISSPSLPRQQHSSPILRP